jgi:hypothetical protein
MFVRLSKSEAVPLICRWRAPRAKPDQAEAQQQGEK